MGCAPRRGRRRCGEERKRQPQRYHPRGPRQGRAARPLVVCKSACFCLEERAPNSEHIAKTTQRRCASGYVREVSPRRIERDRAGYARSIREESLHIIQRNCRKSDDRLLRGRLVEDGFEQKRYYYGLFSTAPSPPASHVRHSQSLGVLPFGDLSAVLPNPHRDRYLSFNNPLSTMCKCCNARKWNEENINCVQRK